MKSVKQTDILTGSIPKQLLLFFLPIWFGTLFQQLYNTADTLIVGNFVGTNALAAVGATGPFVNLLVGLFVGLCSGAGVVIAQSWGAHDPDAVDRQVHTALVLSIAVGALLTVLGLVTAAPIMRLLGTPDEILPDAALYLRIYFLGMIPQMLYNMGTNILRAIGDSKRPLYFLIAASLVNIVLDVVFIAVFGWGVMGAALATVLSQVASAVLTLRCIVGSQGMPCLEIGNDTSSYNLMAGYKEDIDLSLVRNQITLTNNKNAAILKLHDYDYDITAIQYTLFEKTPDKPTETGTLNQLTKNKKKNIKLGTLTFKNTLSENKVYYLKMAVRLNDSTRIYFYTKVQSGSGKRR